MVLPLPKTKKLKAQFGMMVYPFFSKKKGYSIVSPIAMGTRHLCISKEQAEMQTQRKGVMKAQFGMMEHLLLSVIILMIIVSSIFFFFGFQSNRRQAEAFKDDIHKILLAANLLGKTGMLAKDSLMFDDSKLAGFTGAYGKEGCEEIKKLTGEACITIDKTLISGERVDCDPVNFDQIGGDQCNSWTLCKETCFKIQSVKNKGLSIPVNIYRKIDSRVDLGVLTVRIPT